MLGDERTPQRAEAADGMRFGEAVFREAARLKSTAPLLFHEPLNDTTVAGVELPAGTRIVTLMRQAGSPGEGRPLRTGPLAGREAQNPVLLSFGGGPRFCPGRNLAFLEAKAALAMLARNFERELAGPPPREHFGFTMGSRRICACELRPRPTARA